MSKISKIYMWRGVGSLELTFTIGKVKKNITFPPGREKPRLNAQYETEDPVIQDLIENSYLFKKGQMKIISERVITESVKAPVTPTGGLDGHGADKVVKGAFTSVTTYQQAAEKLSKKFDISSDELGDPESIMAVAAKFGATFPNLIE